MAKQTAPADDSKNKPADSKPVQPADSKPVQPLIPSQTPESLLKREGAVEFSVELSKGLNYKVRRVYLTLADFRALVMNSWNDRDLKADSKVIKTQQQSFRTNGYAPSTDPLTGQAKEIVVFWADSGKLRKMISRGHVRTSALGFMADEDAEYANAKVESATYKNRQAAIEKLRQQFGEEAHYHTVEDVIYGVNRERPGYPALLIDSTLSLEEQSALMPDQDTRQAVKSVREQFPLWCWWVGRGELVGKAGKPTNVKTKKQAYDLVCEGKRRVEYENVLVLADTGGETGAKIVKAWLSGSITDSKLDAAVKALREDSKNAPYAPAEDWATFQKTSELILKGDNDATTLKVTPSMVADWAKLFKDTNRLVLAWLLATQGKQSTADGKNVEALTGDEIERLKKWAHTGIEPARQ